MKVQMVACEISTCSPLYMWPPRALMASVTFLECSSGAVLAIIFFRILAAPHPLAAPAGQSVTPVR